MTRYEVIITPAAEADLVESFAYIHSRAPLNAARWLCDLYKAIDGLAEFHGHSRAPESDWLYRDLRHKIFKSHRIIFSIDDDAKRVYVHYVRHGARRAVGEPDTEE